MAWGTKSRHERGYDSKWVKLVEQIRERDGDLCQACHRAACAGDESRFGVKGKDVDHIISKAKAKTMGWDRARTDHPSNLEYLCGPCHKAKSAKEVGKTLIEKREIGEDGWPI